MRATWITGAESAESDGREKWGREVTHLLKQANCCKAPLSDLEMAEKGNPWPEFYFHHKGEEAFGGEIRAGQHSKSEVCHESNSSRLQLSDFLLPLPRFAHTPSQGIRKFASPSSTNDIHWAKKFLWINWNSLAWSISWAQIGVSYNCFCLNESKWQESMGVSLGKSTITPTRLDKAYISNSG